jgi:hypothetical protein
MDNSDFADLVRSGSDAEYLTEPARCSPAAVVQELRRPDGADASSSSTSYLEEDRPNAPRTEAHESGRAGSRRASARSAGSDAAGPAASPGADAAPELQDATAAKSRSCLLL